MRKKFTLKLAAIMVAAAWVAYSGYTSGMPAAQYLGYGVGALIVKGLPLAIFVALLCAYRRWRRSVNG